MLPVSRSIENDADIGAASTISPTWQRQLWLIAACKRLDRFHFPPFPSLLGPVLPENRRQCRNGKRPSGSRPSLSRGPRPGPQASRRTSPAGAKRPRESHMRPPFLASLLPQLQPRRRLEPRKKTAPHSNLLPTTHQGTTGLWQRREHQRRQQLPPCERGTACSQGPPPYGIVLAD
jgi:hypothetical protein